MSGGKESRSSSSERASPFSFMNLSQSNAAAAASRSVSSSIAVTTEDSYLTCSGFSIPKILLTASLVSITIVVVEETDVTSSSIMVSST